MDVAPVTSEGITPSLAKSAVTLARATSSINVTSMSLLQARRLMSIKQSRWFLLDYATTTMSPSIKSQGKRATTGHFKDGSKGDRSDPG